MKISYNWLKDYVDHALSPEELGDALTMSGLELEEALAIGFPLDGVVVGHVLETRAHPNADRLTLCDVDLGEGDPVQIVCGAPNVKAGQKVPVATVGTTLMLPSRDNPEERVPVTLKKAKLRGETSNGMICAEDELGLSDDHAGIMVLREDAAVGQPFAEYLKHLGLTTHDTVLDLAITPNRPDAISHIGVARDVSALTGAPLMHPDLDLPEAGGETAEQVTVEIECPEACHRYVALLVRGVEIKDSPAWLKQRLTAIGLRPRNNVVDITNYVMHECGQPLHAFDFDQLAGHKIIVRQAEGGEAFTTLDSKEHALPADTVMICDAERYVAIGGIMGGENSEVTDATTNVLIESAWFDPSVTRRAAKHLGIASDASYRFERGVDADGQVWAAARAAHLIANLAGGEIVPGMVDAHPTPPEKRVLPLRISRIERILGVAIPKEETIRILTALGFEVEDADPLEEMAEHLMEGKPVADDPVEEVLQCTVPTYRPDVEREIDLIEEVARIYGYDRIPEPTHSLLPNHTPRSRPPAVLKGMARALVEGLGYREVYTNSMLRTEEAQRFNLDMVNGASGGGAVVETLNPITQDMTALRPSLLPEVLKVMTHNQNHGQEVLHFYEFGHIFHRTNRDDVPVPGYAEHDSLILAASGPSGRSGWNHEPHTVDFFDLKGAVETLLDTLHIPDVQMTAAYEPTSVTAHHLALTSGDTPLGIVARLSDEMAAASDLKAPVFFAELDWSTLVGLATPHVERSYTLISRYPVVDRDIALIVNRDEAAGPMMATIREAGAPLLQGVDVFDLYEGEHIGEGKKSVAFALRFGADRTLTDQEVDERIAAILKQLEQQHDAVLRG